MPTRNLSQHGNHFIYKGRIKIMRNATMEIIIRKFDSSGNPILTYEEIPIRRVLYGRYIIWYNMRTNIEIRRESLNDFKAFCEQLWQRENV
jgi:hypothetical protein